MKLIRLFLMAIALVAILSGVMPLSSYAYPGSARAKVVVPMKPANSKDQDHYDCWTAALVSPKVVGLHESNPTFYPATIYNPEKSNECTLTFKDVTIRSDGFFELDYTYTVNNRQYIDTTFIYVTRPEMNTYTTLPVYMPEP